MEGNSGGGGGGNDVELLSKTLQVEHKLFYFDLKENPRGRYLKISEKTSSTRSTIIVPSAGISWFLDLFNYYVNSADDDQDVYSKELQLDSKAPFSLLSYSNFFSSPLTHILALLFESAGLLFRYWLQKNFVTLHSSMGKQIVLLLMLGFAGSARDEGWATFRNILAEINETLSLYIVPNQLKQQTSETSERLGLSDDVGAGFISSHSSQPAPKPNLNIDHSVDLPGPEEINNLGVSKVIRVDQKRFFFDLGSNSRGHFLRISEVAGSDRSSIILPLSGLPQFHEIVGHFVEITKDRIEGMTGANVRTVDPPHR
nr:transcription factor Pur-alpha 1 [Ipomoea batatas]